MRRCDISNSSPIRDIAVFVISSVIYDDRFSDVVINKTADKYKLNTKDTALLSRICYGVIENLYLLDFYISCFSKTKLPKISKDVLMILRVSAYEILYMDKIPDSASVNEAVNSVKKTPYKYTSGFVNAVLRNISRNKDNMPEIPSNDITQYLSIKYSYSKDLVKIFLDEFGADIAEEIFIFNKTFKGIGLRVNTLRRNRSDVIEDLLANNICAEEHKELSHAILCDRLGRLAELDCFKNGDIMVQDISSQICVEVLGAKPHSNVLDMCGAPGGKSFLLAQHMQNKGKIVCCDILENKVSRVKDGAHRLNIDIIMAEVRDATVHYPEFDDGFDYILCDVPCSALGAVRKKPEIRFKKYDDISSLPQTQLKILENASKYLKVGGYIVYSTCTIFSKENIDVVNRFLDKNLNFRFCEFDVPVIGYNSDGYFTFAPHKDRTDGFFVAKLQRFR